MLEPSIPVWAAKGPRGPLAPPRKPDILNRTSSSIGESGGLITRRLLDHAQSRPLSIGGDDVSKPVQVDPLGLVQ